MQTFAVDLDIAFAACRQNQQDNQNKPQKYREQNKSFY